MRGEGDEIDNTRRRVLKGLLELQKVKKIAGVNLDHRLWD